MAAALAIGYLTHRIGFSSIVGYLLAGIVVGPNTPGFVANYELANQLAEIGVILLMFGVGLHFHLEDLLVVRRVAVAGAVGQAIVSTALGTGVALAVAGARATGVVEPGSRPLHGSRTPVSHRRILGAAYCVRRGGSLGCGRPLAAVTTAGISPRERELINGSARAREGLAVAVRVNLHFPSKPTSAVRFDHEDDVAAFVRPLGEFLGFGTSLDDSIDVFIGVPDGEAVKAWVARVCDTLRAAGAPAGTSLAVFPEDDRKFWDPEWWRVEVFGPRGEDGPLIMRMRNDWNAPDGFVELGYV